MADRSKTTLSLSPVLGLALIAALSGAAFAQSEEAKPAQADATVGSATDNPGDASPKPGIAGGHSQAAFIASYDKNGDGKVSLDELIEVRTERFRGPIRMAMAGSMRRNMSLSSRAACASNMQIRAAIRAASVLRPA
ncbi:hypothetical protein [Gemmobacter sp. 24YEA27]|uniref:hypothetical protein n=1 Tax=Gemmobacter sp. 24YEA27 TaxID=3040672 RepID=UPI0024B3C69F|nr:hypothetical protein [Gemmobacter sp. 24YEA27]